MVSFRRRAKRKGNYTFTPAAKVNTLFNDLDIDKASFLDQTSLPLRGQDWRTLLSLVLSYPRPELPVNLQDH